MTVYAVPAAPPAGTAVCPVHDVRVAWQPGFVIGLCPDCAVEVARAYVWLKKHPARRKRA